MSGVATYFLSAKNLNRDNLDSGLPSRRVARRKAVGKGLVHRLIFPLLLAALVNHAIFRVAQVFVLVVI